MMEFLESAREKLFENMKLQNNTEVSKEPKSIERSDSTQVL